MDLSSNVHTTNLPLLLCYLYILFILKGRHFLCEVNYDSILVGIERFLTEFICQTTSRCLYYNKKGNLVWR